MSIADKLVTVAENQQKVYDAGKTAEWSAFWDAFQVNGTRTEYERGFSGPGWTDVSFLPKYDIRPTNARHLLYQSTVTDLIGKLENLGIILDTSNATSLAYAFSSAKVAALPKISAEGATAPLEGTFGWTSFLVTIDELALKADGTNKFSSTFANNLNLTNLMITGVIGQNNFDVKSCTKLTHDSLMSIINALQDKTGDTSGTEWKVTLGSTNKAKLTDTEQQIAYDKGWLVA